MSEFVSALFSTLVSFAAICIGVLFIAYLLAAASYPFWGEKR